MLLNLKYTLFRFFKNGQDRTFNLKRNILFSFFLKGGSTLIALLIVPLTINYINPVQYGIWLTISSLVTWITIFDIGICNGLKNEIACSLAVKDDKNIRKYVSTTYLILFVIAMFIFLLFLLLSSYANWNRVLNIPGSSAYDVKPVVVVVVGFFCLQFVVQIIDAVLSATQQVFKSSIILFSGQALGLAAVYALTLFSEGSLLLLVIAMAGSSVLALLIGSLILYKRDLKEFAPTWNSIDLKQVKKLLNVGLSFFIIQIGAMILIHSNNFIIAKILGPEAVTVYYIPFRLFSFISMLFAIVIMPYWSAFTDAYASNDLVWIKKNIRRLRMIWVYLSLIGVFVFILSPVLYKFWIHDVVSISRSLSFSMLIYIMVFMWHTLHVYFLNGIGKIRLQLILVITGVCINIPLAVYLGRSYGLLGIIWANTAVFSCMGIMYSLQYQKIISQTATKIWNK